MCRCDECLEILINTNRLPEAAFFARTYLPSQVSRSVACHPDGCSCHPHLCHSVSHVKCGHCRQSGEVWTLQTVWLGLCVFGWWGGGGSCFFGGGGGGWLVGWFCSWVCVFWSGGGGQFDCFLKFSWSSHPDSLEFFFLKELAEICSVVSSCFILKKKLKIILTHTCMWDVEKNNPRHPLTCDLSSSILLPQSGVTMEKEPVLGEQEVCRLSSWPHGVWEPVSWSSGHLQSRAVCCHQKHRPPSCLCLPFSACK